MMRLTKSFVMFLPPTSTMETLTRPQLLYGMRMATLSSISHGTRVRSLLRSLRKNKTHFQIFTSLITKWSASGQIMRGGTY